MATTLIPATNRSRLLTTIQAIGENETLPDSKSEELSFLVRLGMCRAVTESRFELSSIGEEFYKQLFLLRDLQSAKKIFRDLLLNQPIVATMQRYFWKLGPVSKPQLVSLLKFSDKSGFIEFRYLTHWLDILNYAGIISYDRKGGAFRVLLEPTDPQIPDSILISPERPYTNVLLVKKVMRECKGFLYWFDKHFQKVGLEWLLEIADPEQVREIKILSLDMGNKNLGKEAKRDYRRLKKELENKGIALAWSVIDSKEVKNIHDRWIIGGNGYLRNVPDANSISSGHRSELIKSENYEEVLTAFNNYWQISQEVK